MLYITSDHGGYQTKEKLKKFLNKKNIEVTDLGPEKYNPEDDYPDFVQKLCEKMQLDHTSLGIVICRNGVGVSMAANKFKNIRAALCFNPKHAMSARNDDNANVLALPADYLGFNTIKKITVSFLNTQFSGEERHLRRLEKLNKLCK